MRTMYMALVLTAVVIMAGFYLDLHYCNQTSQHIITKRIVFGGEEPGHASLRLSASYEIKVYRRGELVAVRHKEDDPITIHWYRMVANMMFGFIRDGALTWLDTGGSPRKWADTEDHGLNPVMYVALGSGVGTPSINDHKLFNEEVKDKAEMNVEDDIVNQRYTVMFTKTFTITQAFTLTEVGLILKVDTNIGTGSSYAYLLVAHDMVSPPVDLVENDAVAVTYIITIPYNVNGPFTKWFYHALINYWLGYLGTAGRYLEMKYEGGANGRIDTAYDRYGGSSHDRVKGEYTYVEIGSGSSSSNPLFEVYKLEALVKRIRIDGPQFANSIDEDGNYTIKYVVGFASTTATTIREIGVTYYTDVKSDNYLGSYYLWLYWIIPEISIGAGDGLRVEIVITIPYT